MDLMTIAFWFFLAVCDVAVFYTLINNICGFKTSLALKKLNPLITIGVLISFFLLSFFLPQIFSTNIFTILFPLLSLGLIYFFLIFIPVRLAFEEKIMAWLISFGLSQLVFIVVAVILAGLINNVNLQGFLMYATGTLLIFLLCEKFDLNKLFVFVSRNSIIKITGYTILIIIFLLFLSTDDIDDLGNNIITILPFLTLMLVALARALRSFYVKSTIIPEAYHDAKKWIMLLGIEAEKNTELDSLKPMLDEALNKMKISAITNQNVGENKEEKLKNMIELHLDKSLSSRKSNNKIFKEVNISGIFTDLHSIKLVYMIMLLFEYCLNTLSKKPIYVVVDINEDEIVVKMNCEYKFPKLVKETPDIFITDEIVQDEIKSDFNLAKLQKLVLTNGGNGKLKRYKHSVEKIEYIEMSFFFKKGGL